MNNMPIYETAYYQVKPEDVQKTKQAIEEFVAYVTAHEPGTQMYAAWQQKNDETKFMHVFIFENEQARAIHSKSAAVKKFESMYGPSLVTNGVEFIEYHQIASNQKRT